jgi:adenosine kinase
MLCERTGLTEETLAARVEALVVTMGAEGSRIHADRATIHVPAVPTDSLVDPTGCGDAYRAGLLYGMSQRWRWEKTGRLASLLGSVKIGSRGGQNHAVDRDTLAALYGRHFDATLW